MRLSYSIRHNCLMIRWGDHLLASSKRLSEDHYGSSFLYHIKCIFNVCLLIFSGIIKLILMYFLSKTAH